MQAGIWGRTDVWAVDLDPVGRIGWLEGHGGMGSCWRLRGRWMRGRDRGARSGRSVAGRIGAHRCRGYRGRPRVGPIGHAVAGRIMSGRRARLDACSGGDRCWGATAALAVGVAAGSFGSFFPSARASALCSCRAFASVGSARWL